MHIIGLAGIYLIFNFLKKLFYLKKKRNLFILENNFFFFIKGYESRQ
jgi:hypothetical protein